jgi:hypothetical protein
MSNGDSLDGFVFPPFIPTASTRPAETPPAPPRPSIQEPDPAPAADAAGRMTMPWDLETPIVRQDDAAPAPQSAADDDEDLPWLEVPTPREAEAAEAPPAAATDEAFPEWLAWDQRDGTAAEADARDTVAPIAGLEDFVPMDDLGGGFVPPPAAADWAEAEPESYAAPAADFDATPAFEAPPSFEAPPAAEPFPEMVFDDALAAEPEVAEEEWSLAAPEAAEPPSVYEAPATTFEESPAAAEPSFEVSVDDDALSFEPAAADAQPFVADDEAVMAAEPEPAVADEFAAPAAEPFAAADEFTSAAPESFAAADEVAAPAADRQPFVADEEAVIASEPDPFTAASVAEAEAVAPAGSAAADSPFDDVAARLESIARMLRERPDELLAGGSSDPLALLVTGYVMGYTARGSR